MAQNNLDALLEIEDAEPDSVLFPSRFDSSTWRQRHSWPSPNKSDAMYSYFKKIEDDRTPMSY
jgi:hypothetical protein